MGKEAEYGWDITLAIDFFRHIKNAGVVPLGVAEQLSLNEKLGGIYKEACNL